MPLEQANHTQHALLETRMRCIKARRDGLKRARSAREGRTSASCQPREFGRDVVRQVFGSEAVGEDAVKLRAHLVAELIGVAAAAAAEQRLVD